MKKCPKCNIEVGGNLKVCPLCKTKLTGGECEPYWPEPKELKKKSAFYKKQLIIVALACVAMLILGLTMFRSSHTHHWALFILWAVVAEVVVRTLLKKYRPIPHVLTELSLSACVLCGFSAIWFAPMLYPVPIIVIGIVATDFCFALADKSGYYLISFLCSVLIGIIAYVLALVFTKNVSIWWHISIAVCAAAFLIMFIVKGRTVFSEIKRRVSM